VGQAHALIYVASSLLLLLHIYYITYAHRYLLGQAHARFYAACMCRLSALVRHYRITNALILLQVLVGASARAHLRRILVLADRRLLRGRRFASVSAALFLSFASQ
jgi:hypothetical protein